MSSSIVVAIDGPSGSGKSSTSRGVADVLGLRYLDTGAMFRAMTWFMLREGVDVSDPQAVAARVNGPLIESGTDPSRPTIAVDGTDVGTAIREQAVTDAVSPVSAVPEVRARLAGAAAVPDRRGRHRRRGPRHRLRGRGPQAQVKVYLTADAGARAVRRAAEEGGSDVSVTEASLRARDAIDSGRATAPLVMADGAHHIDTTPYTLEEVISQVVALVTAARHPEDA